MSLPSSGAMTDFATGAVRDAMIGKGLPSHIPPIAIRKMAKRFEDGALKYNTARPISFLDALGKLDELCSCENTTKKLCATQTEDTRQRVYACSAISNNTQNQRGHRVTQIESPFMTECAGHATTCTLRDETLDTQSDKKRIAESGSPRTLSEQTREESHTPKGIHTSRGPTSARELLPNSGCPKVMSKQFCLNRAADAVFVAAHPVEEFSTSTTAMKQDVSEVFCAADAIKGLDYLGILSSMLSQHSHSCDARRRITFSVGDGRLLIKDSFPNWMKGIPLSRYQDAITRHTLQAAEGDTTEDHLGAVLWNAAAWAWTEEQILNGSLPASLDDLPFRTKKHNRPTPTTPPYDQEGISSRNDP